MFIMEKATYVLGPKLNAKKKKKKTTIRKRRYTLEIRHQRKEQRMKKGSGPQREHPVLQNSQRRGTPLPPRH